LPLWASRIEGMAMIKRLWPLLAILALSVGTAVGEPACSAKTCSRAYRSCTTTHCAYAHGKNCEAHCRPEYERCLQTGEFRGRVCWNHGLERR